MRTLHQSRIDRRRAQRCDLPRVPCGARFEGLDVCERESQVKEIGKFLIDAETAEAFAEWLHTLVQERRKRHADADEEVAKSAIYEARFGKVVDLAKQLARKYGPLEGLPMQYMASATWEMFINGDGWFSEMDIDQYFEADDDWQEVWETAYMDEINTMKGEKS